MLYINGSDIRIPRGDSAVVKFTLTSGGQPYFFADGECAVLSVSDRNTGDTVIEKTADTQDEEGTVSFVFSTADTSIGEAAYVYTVRLVAENGGRVDTVQGFPARSAFTIGQGAAPWTR